jgi:multidrug efflux pump subunit AcrA (membrane-fusion protein)
MNRGSPSSSKTAAVLVFFSFLLGTCGRPPEEPPPLPLERVKTVRVRMEDMRPAVETFGTLTFRAKADVYPAVEGHVEELFAEEGDRVEKGRVLAALSRDRLLLSRDGAASALASKEALLALAEEKLAEGRKAVEARFLAAEKAGAELDRRRTEFMSLSSIYENKKQLFALGGIAEGELETIRNRYLHGKTDLEQAERDLAIQRIGFRDRDIREAGHSIPRNDEERRRLLVELNTRMLRAERNVSEADRESAAAELKRIDLLLSETKVRSPLSGIVARRGAEAGEKAMPETLLFTIFNTDTVYAAGEVGERDLPDIRTGQEAEVRTEGSPPLRGRVRLISPFLNPETRSAGVKILLSNPGGRLLPGMFVRITVFTGRPRTVPVIPESALLSEEEAFFVFAVRGGRLFKVPVVPGERKDGMAAVGLEKGELIAEKPSRSWREGASVEAVE